MTTKQTENQAAETEINNQIDETELVRLEGVIDMDQKNYIEVGDALEVIRTSNAYKLRDNSLTFEAYVKARFDLCRSRAYALIDASKTAHQVQELTGETPATAKKATDLKLVIANTPDLVDSTIKDALKDAKVLANLVATAKTKKRQARHLQNRTDLLENADKLTEAPQARYQIEQGDFREVMGKMPSASVDLILTELDPKADEADAESLSQLAKCLLKPTGILAVMMNPKTMGKLFAGLDSSIPCRGLIAYVTEGKSKAQHWMPIWVGGAPLKASQQNAVITAHDCTTSYVDGQQDVDGIRQVIETLLGKDDGTPKTILDCRCGSGTTLVAGLMANSGSCNVIGCDLDPKNVELAIARCKTELAKGHDRQNIDEPAESMNPQESVVEELQQAA